MAIEDNVGRIHKKALVGSTSALFGLTLVAFMTRLFVRFTVQKEFAIDDIVLVVGLCALIAAFVILQIKVIDRMYITIALQDRVPGVTPPGSMADILEMAYDFHKWVTVTLMLSWCSIMAAKFSVLGFFWRLIDRIYWMKMYWLAVFIFNLGILGYGVSVYYLACPYFYDIRSFTCNSGAGKHRLLTHSSAQTGFDILGDLLILFIPIHIIWRIRIRFAQKVALSLSLGLTIIMVMVTVIRVSGMVKDGLVDTIWEVYWLVIGAEVGIFIASAIAFRAFFVSRGHSKKSTSPKHSTRFFSYSFAKKFHRRGATELESEDDAGLPSIPGAELTGMRTMIENEGRSSWDAGQHGRNVWNLSDVEHGNTFGADENDEK